MSERTSPGLTPQVLVDTHCHVHVLVESGTGCCSATTAIPKQPVHISSNAGSSSGSHCDSSNEGRGVRAEVTDSGEGRKYSVAVVLPEVVHVTMGIREDDWHGAVAFAAGAEDLQRRCGVITPELTNKHGEKEMDIGGTRGWPQHARLW